VAEEVHRDDGPHPAALDRRERPRIQLEGGRIDVHEHRTGAGGLYGAVGSRLVKLLREGHEDVRLTPGELGRVAAWIDLNAIFYGVYLPEAQAAQLRGERVPMPEIQ